MNSYVDLYVSLYIFIIKKKRMTCEVIIPLCIAYVSIKNKKLFMHRSNYLEYLE